MYQQTTNFQPAATYTVGPYAPVYNVESAYTPTAPPFQGERFRPANQCRDLPFSILFILHFLGVGAIIGVGILTPGSSAEIIPIETSGNSTTWELVTMTSSLTGVAIVISVIWLQLMKMFAAPMVYAGIVLTVFSIFASVAWLFVINNIVGGVIVALLGGLVILYFFLARSRIPFAVEMIKAVVVIIQRYPATQVTAYFFLLIQIGWLCLWTFALILSQRFSGTLSYVAFVFLLFSFYWTFEVLKNIVHVTVSGVAATVYFMSNAMPENPTLGALKRSVTSSFGSICLGSMVVAALQTLRALIRMMRSENNSLLLALADCCLACIDSLVRYFNHYAFCQVAIYGKTFCEAANSTWRLIESAGLEAIANDNLIGGVLNMGILFGALLTGAAGAGIGAIFGTFGESTPLIMFFVGLLIGALFMSLSMQVVDSSVACTFVCFAEDKNILRQNNPALWDKLMETYHLNWN